MNELVAFFTNPLTQAVLPTLSSAVQNIIFPLLKVAIDKVRDKRRVEPAPYIAVPAIQALAYSVDSDELRSLFVNLLVKAMLEDERDKVHPAYVEIIKQLSPLDAQNLNVIYSKDNGTVTKLPIAKHTVDKPGSIFPLYPEIFFMENKEYQYSPLQAPSIANLQRLGLIETAFGASVAEDGAYDEFLKHPRYLSWSAYLEQSGEKPKLVQGVLYLSSFGKAFSDVCLT
jgi:hypothetical protein